MFLLANAKIVLAIPFTRSAIPHSIATVQKDITGSPSIMINPIKKRINAAKPLQETEFSNERILLMNATEEILSSKKKTPINAISQRRLILGTISKSIPIVRINIPKNIDQIMLEM